MRPFFTILRIQNDHIPIPFFHIAIPPIGNFIFNIYAIYAHIQALAVVCLFAVNCYYYHLVLMCVQFVLSQQMFLL